MTSESVVFEWSEELTIELVYRVKEHENLWDPLHPDKKKRTKRSDTWKKIAEAIGNGRTADDCQKKWANLCQTYRGYRRNRRGRSGDGAKDVPKITWFAFDTMHAFTNDIYKPQGNDDVGTLNESMDSTAGVDDITEMNSTQNSDYNGHTVEREASNEQAEGHSTPKKSTNRDEGCAKLFKSPKKISPSKRKVGKDEVMKAAYQYLTKKSSTPKSSASVEPVYGKKDEDEYDMFGRLLAEKLRRLDSVTREYAMRDINNIMFEAKIFPRSGTTSRQAY